MERHIGMDVQASSCTLAVISEKGRKLKDSPVEANGQEFQAAISASPLRHILSTGSRGRQPSPFRGRCR